MSILVTGGAGFIGSNFVNHWLSDVNEAVINLDKLTYAGNINNLAHLKNDVRHIFIKGDIADKSLLEQLLGTYKPRAIINFAAESHVDRSIHEPDAFIKTNILGTFRLLESACTYWRQLSSMEKNSFRFLHISTDEVYGSLAADEPAFVETNSYQPNSPYSASKASSDHLVRAFHHTYGLPALITNCSNNYGPFQFPEKLIPLIIHNILAYKPLPIYGDGLQIRDWLYVDDHCRAIKVVLEQGKCGEVYNIGGLNQKSNIEIVHILCDMLDQMYPIQSEAPVSNYRELITHVKDRPGHDRRYAIDITKIENQLHWRPVETFETGIRKTIEWYLNNQHWVEQITGGDYYQWLKRQYA